MSTPIDRLHEITAKNVADGGAIVEATAEARCSRLKALMDEFGQTEHDYPAECEEDVRPYFDGSQVPAPWCCVTQHDGKTCFLPKFEERVAAELRAVEYVLDDVFYEIPVAVVNLDTGERWKPLLEATPWKQVQS